jgi:hypothetical protein
MLAAVTVLSFVLLQVLRLVISFVSGAYGCKNVSPALEQSDWIILGLQYVSHLD